VLLADKTRYVIGVLRITLKLSCFLSCLTTYAVCVANELAKNDSSPTVTVTTIVNVPGMALGGGIAVDSTGNVFFGAGHGPVAGFWESSVIEKATPAGVVTTLAGNWEPPYRVGDGGPNTDATRLSNTSDKERFNGIGSGARFNDPSGIAVDAAGNIYVADTDNNAIRKITPTGVVTTLSSWDGGDAPIGIAVDSAGDIYSTDSFRVWKLTPSGNTTAIAGRKGVSGHSDGAGSIATFGGPRGIAVDNAGNLYVADTSNQLVRKITPKGVVTTLAGNPRTVGLVNGTGPRASFHDPTGVVVDAAGNLYVTDTNNAAIRKITPAGLVTTLAGGMVAGSADGTAATATFDQPSGIAIDRAGNLYVADVGNSAIRKITIGRSPP
jgi:sugar lactone lactonase YvrE